MISQIVFIALLATAGWFIVKRTQFILRNLKLGRAATLSGRASARWKNVMFIALGQKKMFDRPLSAVMHLFIYAGFIIINLEVLEILIDGIAGTHRVFAFAGTFYALLIALFEWLAVLVIVACVVFLARRNLLRIKRFHMREMTTWPKSDANIILVVEVLLMSAFLLMNSADFTLLSRGLASDPAGNAGDAVLTATAFPVSSGLAPALHSLSDHNLHLLERFCWWFHIAGILGFIVYLSYSKHLHIILAFVNTYRSRINQPGALDNLPHVSREVKLMLDPGYTPAAEEMEPRKFGARDVMDLDRNQLIGAYSCTECGRCTAECPANLTGKKLSPRKIMMDTRDRLEEVGRKMDAAGGNWTDDGRSLLHDYITEEELWACTSCNACTRACPVNINPLDIIIDLRRYLIMEESKSPESLTTMFNNIENSGSPWAMSAADRAAWTQSQP
jgi:heterodisulfide reductase subunit C